MTDRFKSTLGVHPAWRNGITIPAAVLRQYRALGLDNGKLAYILQIIAAYWQGDEAGHTEIGQAMGINPRQLRKYNKALVDIGLLGVNGRYMHGNRLENDYDLTPLLDAALALDIEQGGNRKARIDTAYSLIDQLVDAVDGKGNVQELLEQLSQEWRSTAEKPSGATAPIETGSTAPIETGSTAPIETGSTAPIETGSTAPIETGSTAPLSTGSTEPLSTGSTAPPKNAATRQNPTGATAPIETGSAAPKKLVVGSSQSLSFKNKQQTNSDRTLIPKLQKLGASKNKAREIIHHAIKSYGENSGTVLNNWIAYVDSQDTFTHPAVYILGRVKDNDEPPIMPAAVVESAIQSQEKPAFREI